MTLLVLIFLELILVIILQQNGKSFCHWILYYGFVVV